MFWFRQTCFIDAFPAIMHALLRTEGVLPLCEGCSCDGYREDEGPVDIVVEKIPGGFRVDGLDLKNGKCGCTSVLPCCYSWSRVKRAGDTFTFIAKTTGPATEQNFTWSYRVTKGSCVVEVTVEDARDKTIFSGFYPPPLEAWVGKGWIVAEKQGEREDFGLWRCAACRWLYKTREREAKFEDLPADWKCPVCRSGKGSFENVG
jgi:rubredoxin